MASINTLNMPHEPTPRAPLTPPLTWGDLCSALADGLIPAAVEDGAYVVRVGALRRSLAPRPPRIPRAPRATRAMHPWHEARLATYLPTQHSSTAKQPAR